MKVELDAHAIEQLARSSEVREALVKSADRIAEEAKQLAHREFYQTGAYERGIKVAPVGLPDGTLAGQVQATDWKSHWAEFGWTDRGGKHHPPRAILLRGAEAAGFTPTPLPK